MEEKFGAVVVAGIAVFGLMFVLNQGGTGDGFLTAQEPRENVTVFEDSIGKVGDSNPDFRNIELGDFTVGEARGDIEGYTNSQAVIRDKMFGGENLEFYYNATAPKEADITFDVLGREGKGAVYVKANGKKVFEESMITSTSPKITVPEEYLNPGGNSFELGVKRGGIFSSSEYVLEDIELKVNDRKFHEYTDNFNIYEYELEDYKDSSLEFGITKSVKTAPLEILVNGNEVYSKPQVRISPEEVDINPSNADLTPGNNVIEFKTDKGARYDISSAQATIQYLGNVDSQKVVMGFESNASEREFIDREDTEEKIIFEYQNLLPSPRPLRIDLNEFNTTLTPENGQNNFDIPEGALESLNRLEIRSNGTYKMDGLKVISEKVE